MDKEKSPYTRLERRRRRSKDFPPHFSLNQSIKRFLDLFETNKDDLTRCIHEQTEKIEKRNVAMLTTVIIGLGAVVGAVVGAAVGVAAAPFTGGLSLTLVGIGAAAAGATAGAAAVAVVDLAVESVADLIFRTNSSRAKKEAVKKIKATKRKFISTVKQLQTLVNNVKRCCKQLQEYDAVIKVLTFKVPFRQLKPVGDIKRKSALKTVAAMEKILHELNKTKTVFERVLQHIRRQEQTSSLDLT